MGKVYLGILAGTGFYDLGLFDDTESVEVETPYGRPSAPYEIGYYKGKGIAFLPRHGKEHTIPPHRVNFCANIWGLKELGVEKVIGINSMGSLKPEIRPPCIAIPHDYVSFFDIPTFYNNEVKHATPKIDEDMRSLLIKAAKDIGLNVRDNAVAVQTRGPRFETPAEIRILAGWGDLVGMNMASEATLCSELSIPYANIATVDNYANGVMGEVPTFEKVLSNSKRNAERVRSLLKKAVEILF